MNEKINYVVACWAGPRRFMHPAYAADRTIFLKLHLRQLGQLRHDLALVTVVVNEFPDPAFDAYADTLDGQKVRETPIRVLRRPNTGMSYGAWADVFLRDRETFSHYLWIEDDYVVVQDHFDTKMLEMMRSSSCDYLCGFAADLGLGKHAAISNGLVSSKVLSRVYKERGTLPHASSAVDYGDNYRQGQIGMSRAILEVGGTLGDFTGFGWAAPWSDYGQVRSFRNPEGPLLIAPAEMLLSAGAPCLS